MVPELQCLARETPYPLDAFIFVQRGLEFTVNEVHGDADPSAEPTSRHVSGEALCKGLRQYALHEYGLLARMVLERWSINSCKDFGRIVFAMVDAKLLAKTDQDTIDDFCGVYEFDDAFDQTLSLA